MEGYKEKKMHSYGVVAYEKYKQSLEDMLGLIIYKKL